MSSRTKSASSGLGQGKTGGKEEAKAKVDAMDTEQASSGDEDRQPQQQGQQQQQQSSSSGEPSSSDEEPESMSSNTKQSTKTKDRYADDVGQDSFGKRKADDFLRRQELAMDTQFKARVVLPGDDVTESTTRTTRSLRLGSGLVQRGEAIVATRAGMLRYRPPCAYWVENNGRRYSARVEDQVIGIVEDRMGESYKVNVFGRCDRFGIAIASDLFSATDRVSGGMHHDSCAASSLYHSEALVLVRIIVPAGR